MSDTPTPRTDDLDASGASYNDMLSQSRTLEAELNSANSRIAELEKRDEQWKVKWESTMETWSAEGVRRTEAEESLTRQLSEAQALSEKQRLILVANQKIMDGAGDTIAGLKAQLASAREDGAQAVDALRDIVAIGSKEPENLHESQVQRYSAFAISIAATALNSARGVTSPPTPTETAPASTWQPIETAPKDGTNILVSNGLFVHEARWSGAQWCTADTWENWWIGVTLWQPLPPPPTTKGKEAA